ncbi:MAG: hypothetical protein O3C10_10290 [Chloroflexi bacterium]|nr:hypothetical protein [Chloroflexota bacterium]
MRTHVTRLLAISVVIFSTMFAACSSDGGDEVVLELSGIRPLQDGFHYEGWAFVGETPSSLGKFNVADDGQLTTVN